MTFEKQHIISTCYAVVFPVDKVKLEKQMDILMLFIQLIGTFVPWTLSMKNTNELIANFNKHHWNTVIRPFNQTKSADKQWWDKQEMLHLGLCGCFFPPLCSYIMSNSWNSQWAVAYHSQHNQLVSSCPPLSPLCALPLNINTIRRTAWIFNNNKTFHS